MRILNHILTAANAKLKSTNWWGGSTAALDGLPLGTVGASATGEIGVKVIVLGGSVSISSVGITSVKGAASLATSQVTSTGSAATLAIARATRRSVLFTNTHASASVRIGPATVTAGNGQILGPGQSCPFTWVGLFQIIDDNTTHCVICVADEYD